MNTKNIKNTWLGHFSKAPETLKALSSLNGAASVFNANIDAVLKVTPEKLAAWLDETE